MMKTAATSALTGALNAIHRILRCSVAGGAIALLAATGADAAILNDWQLNDTAGTELNALNNDAVGGVDFGGTVDGSTADGSGFFSVESTAGNSRTADLGATYTTGTHYLRVDIDSWDLSTGATDDGVLRFGFRDQGEGEDIMINLENTGGAVSLSVRTSGPLDNVTSFGETLTGGLDIVLGVDLVADTYSLWYRAGSDPWTFAIDGGTPGFSVTDWELERVKFVANGSIGEGADFISVDSILHADTRGEVGLIPEPSSLAMIGVAVFIIRGLRDSRRRAIPSS